MGNIFIGIPCYGSMPGPTEEDYMRFMYYLGRRYREHDFFMGIRRKAEQFRARNAIVEAAYQVGADYLLMLDDDQVIDIDGGNGPSEHYEFLRKLLEHFEDHPEAGIIGALYFHRGGECRPVLMSEQGGAYCYLRDDQIKHDLQQVDVQGGGCMLIKMKVFDKIGAAPFEPEFKHGTDIQVCSKARMSGFKIYCDTSIVLGHVKNKQSIVTHRNRHLHFAETTDQSDIVMRDYHLGRILREFRADVMEYLGIKEMSDLVKPANTYAEHQARFGEYSDRRQYYIDSGDAYLARACFIHSAESQKAFDHHLLQIIKADVPGVGLDFGCGAAPISFEFCRRGHQIWFYDIEGSRPFEFLKWRAAKYNLVGTKAVFSTDWPGPGVCDYALFLDSIEHLRDGEWQFTLKSAARSLKHAGCLITNFVLLEDYNNPEHTFMDKPEFMRFMTELRLWPINPVIYQKREDFHGDHT